MATSDDRRAALLLLALTASGLLVRVVMDRTEAPGAVGYRAAAAERPTRDSVADRARRLSRPLQPGETVDPDVAAADELARLPRVGPGLAARIVADREQRGRFGSLEGLGRVAGIGPRTLAMLEPHVRFARPLRGGPRVPAQAKVRVNRASAERLASLPGIGPALAAAIVEDRAARGPYRRAEDLLRVPGIGPKTVARLRSRILLP